MLDPRSVSIAVVLSLLLLNGCSLFFQMEGHARLTMDHPDGHTISCGPGIYNANPLWGGTRRAMRILKSCVTLCSAHGFVARPDHWDLDSLGDAASREDVDQFVPKICTDKM